MRLTRRLAAFVLALLPGIALAETFAVDGAACRFEAPRGFTPLTKEEIAAKFPSMRAPVSVVGNARRTTTVAYELKPDRLTLAQLPEAKQAFEQIFERVVPGLRWTKRELVTMQGQSWIHFEFTSRAIDTDIHNIMLATSRAGRMLVFNYNATAADFEAVEADLRASILSIRLDAQ